MKTIKEIKVTLWTRRTSAPDDVRIYFDDGTNEQKLLSGLLLYLIQYAIRHKWILPVSIKQDGLYGYTEFTYKPLRQIDDYRDIQDLPVIAVSSPAWLIIKELTKYYDEYKKLEAETT